MYLYLIVNHFESGVNSTYAVKPGSYHTTRPRTVRQYHDALRTTYNLRAKEGFQYWLLERPKPTPCKWCMILRECLVWSCLLNAPALFNPKLTAFHIKCVPLWALITLFFKLSWNGPTLFQIIITGTLEIKTLHQTLPLLAPWSSWVACYRPSVETAQNLIWILDFISVPKLTWHGADKIQHQ